MGRIVGSQAVYLLVRLRLPRACIGILRELFSSRAARIVVGGGAYRHGGATADGAMVAIAIIAACIQRQPMPGLSTRGLACMRCIPVWGRISRCTRQVS